MPACLKLKCLVNPSNDNRFRVRVWKGEQALSSLSNHTDESKSQRTLETVNANIISIPKNSLFLLFCLISCVPACAFNFKVLDTSDGLSNNTVKCIVQDKQGFMWFGTFSGLCRFDGVHFSVFKNDPEGVSALTKNHITHLLPVDNGIWVGTQWGLFFFSFADQRFYECCQIDAKKEEIPLFGPIRGLFMDETSLYVLTDELFVWQEKYQFRVCDFRSKDKWVNAVAYKNGCVIAHNSHGVFLLDPPHGRIISHLEHKVSYETDVVYYDSDKDIIYVGHGLGRPTKVFRLKDEQFEELSVSIPSNVKTVVEYHGGTLFGTDGNGLIFQKLDQREAITPENSNISSDAIYSLCVDRDNNVWIGTYRGGVNYYSKRNDWFTTYTMEKRQLTHNLVTAIRQATDGTLYLGLDGGGLEVYTRGEARSYTTANSRIPGNNVLSVVDDEQYVWLGIWGRGLSRFDKVSRTFRSYVLPTESGAMIWVIKDDGEGHLWIGSEDGIYCFDKNTERFLVKQNMLQYVSEIALDGDSVWVSTSNSGLYKLDRCGNIIKRYHTGNKELGIASNMVRYVFVDSQHRIWFSTGNLGLNKLEEKKGKVTFYGKEHGLTSPDIISIIEDANGYLWMGTNDGLFRFDVDKERFIRLGEEDNLLFTQFNFNACYQNKGVMYFGTTKGMISFKPDEIVYDNSFESIYFTDFQLYNGQVKVDDAYRRSEGGVELPYDKTFFTISFSTPELSSPGKIQFSYYLKNFDKEWQNAGTDRKASYTNVPPGEYVFCVRSTNSQGEWNQQHAEFPIIITSPWWKSLPAILLWYSLVIGMLCLFFWLYRHELNNKHTLLLKEMEKNTARNINEAKLNFFTNITHELRTPIFLITAPLEELIASDKSTVHVPKSYLTAMYRNAMRLNKLISRIIDFRKLESGKLQLDLQASNVVTFCKELVGDYEALCEQKEIALLFLPSVPDIHLAFDQEKLETILSNLIGNAMKYTPEGGQILVTVEEKEGGVAFLVEDDGIGIEKEYHDLIFDRFFQVDSEHAMGDGIGLAFVKHLVELHGGTITVESKLNVGSKFRFTIPNRVFDSEPEQPDESSVLAKGEKRTKETNLVHNPMAPHVILMIDDEKETVEIIERSFAEEYKVIKAYNGIDGLAMVREQNPDLIICDIMMPKMNGIEFLTALRGDKTIAQIPVIMFTAKTAEDDMLNAFDQGADAYLTKPVSIKFLKKRVEHLLSQAESINITSFMMDSKANYSKEEKKFLFKCKLVIDQNLMNTNFDVILLAEKLSMSHSALYKKIKGLTGKSVIEFINEYRLYKAVQCFMEGKTNINEVCMECGFNDTKNFREAFKKKMGVPPRQYIQEL